MVFADAEASALLGGQIYELCHPDQARWEVVKHNPSRTVYRGCIGDEMIYLKHFHSRSLIHRLGRKLGLSDAMCEMQFAQRLASVGVPTVPVLAAMCDNGREWLASRAVWPVQPADAWHVEQIARGPDGRRKIQQAIVELARIVARMHAASVIHRDLHCGNVLVRTDGDRPRLVLTDLHRARRGRRLSRRAKAANLAQIFYDRYAFTTRTERLRFLRHYLLASGAEGALRGWHVLVEGFARRHTRRQLSQRDRRISGCNKYFTRLAPPGRWRGHAVLASKRRMAGSRAAEVFFEASAWQELLRDPEKLFEGPDVQAIKDSRSSKVLRRRLVVGGHAVEVFIKRRRRKHWWKAPLDCFRPGRAIRAFRHGHMLLARRIATALPLAALERRVGPVLADSILITEAVDAPKLNDFVDTWLSRRAVEQARLTVAEQRRLARDLYWQLGRLVQRLHDNSFAHRDLKATNILVRWTPGAVPEIVLVDLDGLRLRRHLTTRRRFQGLMRLNVSLLKCPAVYRTGRLRMLLGYLRRPGAGRINFKPYWRVLQRWSAKKLKQRIRSRRKRQKAARRP